MTRSRKNFVKHVCSKPRDETHRRRERHKVKESLNVDMDSDVPYRNPKELGKDEWGTWFGECLDLDENEKGLRK
jgi:hypothetical protein